MARTRVTGWHSYELVMPGWAITELVTLRRVWRGDDGPHGKLTHARYVRLDEITDDDMVLPACWLVEVLVRCHDGEDREFSMWPNDVSWTPSLWNEAVDITLQG